MLQVAVAGTRDPERIDNSIKLLKVMVNRGHNSKYPFIFGHLYGL